MEDVLDDVNAQILDQCQRYLDKDEAFVDEYSTVDIGKEIDQLNPTLMNAIRTLTKSASERRGKQTSSREQHKKGLGTTS